MIRHDVIEPGCALLILSLLVICAGLQAARLNALYYTLHPPFYDSMDYTRQLANVVNIRRTEGFWPAMQSAKTSTVFLPFFAAGLLGSVADASRTFGIWYQTFWLWILCVTFFFYLLKCRHGSAWLALALTLPILGFSCLYRFNGGLSDFRMDLTFAIMYCSSSIVYFCTYATGCRLIWVAFGVLTGLTLLSRATAPVFFVLGFFPPMLARIWCSGRHERRVLLANAALACGIAAVLSVWFYLDQFDHLHYYYAVWNPDARASLSLAQSSQHITFALNALGWSIFAFIIAWYLVRLCSTKFSLTTTHVISLMRQCNWVALWVALAPVVFLVLRGAGLNPFVSMPSAFALYVFLAAPLCQQARSHVSQDSVFLLFGLAIAVLLQAIPQGITSHLEANTGRMSAHREVLDTLFQDAKQLDKKQILFTTIHTYYMTTASLFNVLTYDYPSSWKDRVLVVEGISFRRVGYLTPAVEVEWEHLSGTNRGEKLESVTRFINEKIDYVVLPTDETLDFLETHIRHVFVNIVARSLKTSILNTGRWTPVSATIQQSVDEKVVVYRNDNL